MKRGLEPGFFDEEERPRRHRRPDYADDADDDEVIIVGYEREEEEEEEEEEENSIQIAEFCQFDESLKCPGGSDCNSWSHVHLFLANCAESTHGETRTALALFSQLLEEHQHRCAVCLTDEGDLVRCRQCSAWTHEQCCVYDFAQNMCDKCISSNGLYTCAAGGMCDEPGNSELLLCLHCSAQYHENCDDRRMRNSICYVCFHNEDDEMEEAEQEEEVDEDLRDFIDDGDERSSSREDRFEEDDDDLIELFDEY